MIISRVSRLEMELTFCYLQYLLCLLYICSEVALFYLKKLYINNSKKMVITVTTDLASDLNLLISLIC